jgi:hypothetical protein
VAPLRLRGLRGKQSTPCDWLGGTGEDSTIGEREAARKSGSGTEHGKRHGARTSSEVGERQRYDFISGSVDCLVILLGKYDVFL